MIDTIGIVSPVDFVGARIDVIQESTSWIVGQRPELVHDLNRILVETERVEPVRRWKAVNSRVKPSKVTGGNRVKG